MERKKAIDMKLKEMREIDQDLRTQIRIGDNDLEVWYKHQAPNRWTKYSPMNMNTLDPANKFPKIESKSKNSDPKNDDRINKALEKLNSARQEKIVDNDGFETVNNKRKPSEEEEERRKLIKESTPERICDKLRKINGEEEMESGESSSSDDSDDKNLSVLEVGGNLSGGNPSGGNYSKTGEGHEKSNLVFVH